MRLEVLSGIRPSFPSLSLKCRADYPRVTHPFATRVSLKKIFLETFPFDLHVLSTPPAFVLSQDQTLQTKTPSITRRNFQFLEIPDKTPKLASINNIINYTYTHEEC